MIKRNKSLRKTCLTVWFFIVFFGGAAIGFFFGHWNSIAHLWLDSMLKSEKRPGSNLLLSERNENQNIERLTHAIVRLKNENALKNLQLSFLKSLIDLKTGKGMSFRAIIATQIDSLGLTGSDLIPILHKYLDFETDQSQPAPLIKSVASRLAEIAAENILYPASAESAVGDYYSPVYFSSLVNSDSSVANPRNDFYENDVKIYAG